MKLYTVILVLGLCVMLVTAKANGKKKDRGGKRGQDRGGRDHGGQAEGAQREEIRGKPDRGKGGKGDRRGSRPGRPDRVTSVGKLVKYFVVRLIIRLQVQIGMTNTPSINLIIGFCQKKLCLHQDMSWIPFVKSFGLGDDFKT